VEQHGYASGNCEFVMSRLLDGRRSRFDAGSIVANTVYVASYFAPAGRVSSDPYYFSSGGVTSGSLYVLRNGESGGNGVYVYGANQCVSKQSFNLPITG